MNYKKNKNRFSVIGRGEYMTKSEFIREFYMNLENCVQFFFNIRWPSGYSCENCGCCHCYKLKGKYRCVKCKHDERLLTGTCFQDNKLPFTVLLYGIFLIFTSKQSISSMELAEELKVNYKTATLL